MNVLLVTAHDAFAAYVPIHDGEEEEGNEIDGTEEEDHDDEYDDWEEEEDNEIDETDGEG